jgi:hypothetical protein
MGVYREPVRSAVVSEDVWGKLVVQDGGIVGHVWSHCALRGAES